MNIVLKKYFSLFVLVFGMFLLASTAYAAGLGDWKTNLDAGTVGTGLSDSAETPEDTIASVIKIFLSLLGIIFFLLMFYAGFMWMTARGNESQVTTAKETMIAAIIGLIIVVASYAISMFVIDALAKGTLG